MGAGTTAFGGNQPSKKGRVTKREILDKGGAELEYSRRLYPAVMPLPSVAINITAIIEVL